MSCTVYIETELIGRGLYEFVWSVAENTEWNASEDHKEYQTNDRLIAAIINLGKVCRCLADNNESGSTVEIKTDKDGLDHRYNGEHDILYALVCPKDDFEARKLRSLYHEYEKYLGRIKQLQLQWNITIKLVE